MRRVYVLEKGPRNLLLRHGHKLICDGCNQPLEIGQVIVNNYHTKELFHAPCYVSKRRSRWDGPTPDISLKESRSRNCYLCPTCGIVHAKVFRRGMYLVKMTCPTCDGLITGPKVYSKRTIGFCVNCGTAKLLAVLNRNLYLEGFSVCSHVCATACRKKLRVEESKSPIPLIVPSITIECPFCKSMFEKTLHSLKIYCSPECLRKYYRKFGHGYKSKIIVTGKTKTRRETYCTGA